MASSNFNLFTATKPSNFANTPLDRLGVDSKKSGFLHQIRDQLFYIEIWMFNQLKGEKPFGVPFSLVHGLAIEETLFDFNVKGWIVLNTDAEIIERGAAGDDIKAPFIFRTDGRNKISIKIYPLPNNAAAYDIGANSDTLPKDKWEMNFDCVIYDVEDLPTNSAQIKLRKFYFWDERYQYFLERNIEWSTGVQGLAFSGERPEQPYLLTDEQRSVPASVAIKSLIDSAAILDPKSDSAIGNSIKIGYTESGSINTPDLPLNLFSINWDNGYPETNKGKRQDLIFYNSPANSCVLDDLNYLLQNAISQQGNPVFLRYGRSSVEKEWNLFGLEEIFKNSEENQVEHLMVEDGITPQKPYIPRAYSNFSSDIQNFMSGFASRIKEYKFSPMVSIDDNKLVNMPLHHYDFSTGTFNVYAQENTVTEVANKLTEAGKTGLFGLNQTGSHVLMNINKTKKDGIMLQNLTSTRPFVPSILPKLIMMKDALFLNEALCFTANGLTIRSPGRFLFIDSVNSNENNPFDDRFLGQWMITKVVHVFTKTNYITEVVANKIDTFSKIWNVEDENL
jgi:hypothetical protein